MQLRDQVLGVYEPSSVRANSMNVMCEHSYGRDVAMAYTYTTVHHQFSPLHIIITSTLTALQKQKHKQK